MLPGKRVPLASRASFPPSSQVTSPAGAGIHGVGAMTVRWAIELVTTPTGLLAIRLYDPASESCGDTIVKVGFVCPAIGTPLNNHWRLNGGAPRTTALKSALIF